MDRLALEKIIKQKIDEHKFEINGCLKEMSKYSTVEGQNRETVIKQAQMRAILKDKTIFHQACAACLQDLLEDVTKL